VLWIRQSSGYQKKHNTGSADYQRAQLQALYPLGLTDSLVLTMDARGESGKADSRPHYEALLAHIRATKVRVVVVAFADRLARKTADLTELTHLLQARGGYIVVGGQIFDTNQSGDMLVFGILGQLAEFDNTQRVLRSLTAKLAKARQCQYPVRLPTGLTWAAPSDPAFAAQACRAGIGDMLTADAIAAHRPRVTRDGVDYYILPHPDRDVLSACRLAIAWLLETGSLSTVIHRIGTHPDWPRPGQFPARTRSPFQGDVTATWRPVVDRADGREDLGRQTLRDWVQSPALFGTYAFSVPCLRDLAPAAVQTLGGGHVWIDGAFPSMASPETRTEVARLIAARAVVRKGRPAHHQRDHVLPNLRCGHTLKGGEVCDTKLAAVYGGGRRSHRYGSPRCWRRGHSGVYPASIESVSLDLIQRAYQSHALERTIASARIAAGSMQRELNALDAHRAALQRRSSALQELLVDAVSSRRLESTREFKNELEATHTKVRDLDQRRTALEVEARKTTDLSREEFNRITRLAQDVPRLLELAAASAGLRRRVVSHLASTVRIRRVQGSFLWLEAEFPGGARLGSGTFGKVPPIPRSVRAFVAQKLGLQAPATWSTVEEAEADLARAVPVAEQLVGHLSDHRWTADRVLLAAHMGPPPAGRAGGGATIEELAARRGIDPELALRDILRGKLGPAWLSNGALVVHPTPRELTAYGLRSSTGSEALAEHLRSALPAGTDPTSGSWMELREALLVLRPVHRQTLSRHAVCSRPGMGYQGARSMYVWVDSCLRQRLGSLNR
jgi:DNA invertase Pin-like site-specific DNA recombinase